MKVRGSLQVPGDKSISHRALILAALADGRSEIAGILESADVGSTAGALRALHADVPALAGAITVRGSGLRGLREASMALDCGNSGTTARLMAGVAAASPFMSRFVGDASLSRRPMRRVARPLEAMGARISLEEDRHLPMTVRGGRLSPLAWRTDVPSAQVKSALLLAGLVAGVPVTVQEPAPSRDHTERLLGALGVPVMSRPGLVSLEPAAVLRPIELTIPGDPSSAAFFIALGALASRGELTLSRICLNATRTGFLQVLRRMGAWLDASVLETQGGEPVGSVHVRPSVLTATQVGALEVPSIIDELPLLACVATRAVGATEVTGAQELRVKESDRIATVVHNLRALGADAEELPDGLRVVGARGRALRGLVHTAGDHRIAMAFAVLGALPGNEIAIDDPACVHVSYPRFWADLERVRA